MLLCITDIVYISSKLLLYVDHHNNYMYIDHPNVHVLYYKMPYDILTLYSDVLIL